MYQPLRSSDVRMKGNGGHPSSLRAATTGRPPPDRGPMVLGNPMEEEPEEEFKADLSPGSRNDESQESVDSWGEEDFDQSKNKGVEYGGFAEAVKAIFPGGIGNSNRNSGNATVAFNTVTPNANRQIGGSAISSRGGRGGMLRRTLPPHLPEELGTYRFSHSSIEVQSQEVEILEPSEIKPRNDFRKASQILNKGESAVFKLLPEHEQPALASLRTYTFMAELQFNKPISDKGLKQENSKEFSVPTCLGQWVKRTREFNPDLIDLRMDGLKEVANLLQ